MPFRRKNFPMMRALCNQMYYFIHHLLFVLFSFLFQYLDNFYRRYPHLGVPYLIRLIKLYIQFGRDKLMTLLRATDQYPLNEALQLCDQAKLTAETVYLLTRIGRRQEALQLIMTRVRVSSLMYSFVHINQFLK